MKRFPVFVCLAFLLMLAGTASADSLANTTTATTNATPGTTSDRTGGSIYFDTDPAGAAIWLDNVSIGTGPFTYYTGQTGTFSVRVWKKGYENYTGTVTVSEGKRVVFEAWLTEASRKIIEENTLPVTPVATATTIRKSTIDIPTPWPTSAPASPGGTAVVIGAAALAIGLAGTRRR